MHLPKDLREKLTSKGKVIETLDHEFLIIGDSNTHLIQEEMIKHNISAAKVLVIKINETTITIDKMTITKVKNSIQNLYSYRDKPFLIQCK